MKSQAHHLAACSATITLPHAYSQIPFLNAVPNTLTNNRTSYDTSTKQHWLSVYRSKLKARFLLKDHGKTVGNTRIHNAMEEQKRVCDAVDHMIQSLQQAEVGQ